MLRIEPPSDLQGARNIVAYATGFLDGIANTNSDLSPERWVLSLTIGQHEYIVSEGQGMGHGMAWLLRLTAIGCTEICIRTEADPT